MNEDDRNKRRDALSSVVQEALVSAARQALGPVRALRVTVNQKTGDIRAFAKLLVVEIVSSKHDDISLPDAKRIDARAEVGEELEVDVTSVGFARIATQYAKRALMEQIRRAEKPL